MGRCLQRIRETKMTKDRDHTYLMPIEQHVGSRNDSSTRQMARDTKGIPAMKTEQEHREQLRRPEKKQQQLDAGEHLREEDHAADTGSTSGATGRGRTDENPLNAAQNKDQGQMNMVTRNKLEPYKELGFNDWIILEFRKETRSS